MANRSDTPIAMQKALENLIASLKPKQGEPNHSQKRRMYDLLYSRYVDQFSQKEVADQLGISLRTYQREQQLALEFLAGTLAEKYPSAKLDLPVSPVELETDYQDAEGADYTEEFSWMFTPSSERSSSLEAIVASACQLVRPLAERYRVNLDIDLGGALPKVAIHSEALLQIVLNVLNVAVHQSMGGDIRINARLVNWEANLTVEGTGCFCQDHGSFGGRPGQHGCGAQAGRIGGWIDPGGGGRKQILCSDPPAYPRIFTRSGDR